jgi:hypothetical protein
MGLHVLGIAGFVCISARVHGLQKAELANAAQHILRTVWQQAEQR